MEGNRHTGQLDKFFIYRFLKEKAFKHMMHISDPHPCPRITKVQNREPKILS